MLQAGTYSVTMHGVLSISELYCYNSIPTQISTFLLSPATTPAIASTIAVGMQVTGACNIQGWYRSGGNMIFEDNMETNAELSASSELQIRGQMLLLGNSDISARNILLEGNVTSSTAGISIDFVFEDGFQCGSAIWSAASMSLSSRLPVQTVNFYNSRGIVFTGEYFFTTACLDGSVPFFEFQSVMSTELQELLDTKCSSAYRGELIFATGTNTISTNYTPATVRNQQRSTLYYFTSLNALYDEGGELHPPSGCTYVNTVRLSPTTNYYHSISEYPDRCEMNSVMYCNYFDGGGATLFIEHENIFPNFPPSGYARLDLVVGNVLVQGFAASPSSAVTVINDRDLYIYYDYAGNGIYIRTNEPPTSLPLIEFFISNIPITITAPGVLLYASDPDGDAIEAYQVIGSPDVILNLDGSFVVNSLPALSSFSFVVMDSFGSISDPVTVTLTLFPLCLAVTPSQAIQASTNGGQLPGSKPLLIDGDQGSGYLYSGANFCASEDSV